MAEIGLIGLAVMGENLVLNMANHGHTVAVFNRTTSKVDNFVEGRGKNDKIIGTRSLEEFSNALSKPRKAMIMVKAGFPVDATIEGLLEYFEAGDVIIDGGNSNYNDSERRFKQLKAKGIHFVGCGVSGGEEGALKGPSIMPGGAREAWPLIKDILQDISAKAADGAPCCDWIGDGASGHYVKMVHNGIEYGDMQLIAEGYFLLKHVLGKSNDEMQKIFSQWNTGAMDSYLVEITAEILGKKDELEGADPSKHVLDVVMDTAGQKGTGKWTAINALDIGMPVTLIGEAVFARCLSSLKDERVSASKSLKGPAISFDGDADEFVQQIHNALYAAKIVSYAQGFVLLKAAGKEFGWELNFGAIASMWRGGCIIRSAFLSNIKEAFDKNSDLDNLLLDDYFQEQIQGAQDGWRKVAAVACLNGIAVPAITTALSYYDGYRTADGPANMIQAQRDYFGAHTYERKDKERGQFFHCDWTGHGGTTTSNSYNA